MKVSLSVVVGHSGIELRETREPPRPRRVPNPNANQTEPRTAYVYAHVSEEGVPFYIGRGYDRIAWEADRQYLWHYFVNKHLGGKYRVLILEEGLDNEQANEAKAEWMRQETATLVNWQNPHRPEDLAAWDRFHKLRDGTRKKGEHAKALEFSDVEGAVKVYRECIASMRDYASIQATGGMVGKLIDEERADLGISGEVAILDRLTVCLKKLGRVEEAKADAQEYFARFRRDIRSTAGKAVCKRVGLQYLLKD